MTHVSRRSFLVSSAAAVTAGSLLNSAQAAEVIPGFDQTRTDFDRTKAWKPFSDRKVRVGIVGHGVCRFGLAFHLQHHPNVELVAVSDLFPDRCTDMARKAKRRTRRWKRWSRTIRSSPSTAPPTLRPTPSTPSSVP